MPAALIIALIQQVPNMIAAAQLLRANLSSEDQTSLNAAIAAAQAAAAADVAQTVADLKA